MLSSTVWQWIRNTPTRLGRSWSTQSMRFIIIMLVVSVLKSFTGLFRFLFDSYYSIISDEFMIVGYSQLLPSKVVVDLLWLVKVLVVQFFFCSLRKGIHLLRCAVFPRTSKISFRDVLMIEVILELKSQFPFLLFKFSRSCIIFVFYYFIYLYLYSFVLACDE